jgi:hypothetical protein
VLGRYGEEEEDEWAMQEQGSLAAGVCSAPYLLHVVLTMLFFAFVMPSDIPGHAV